MFGICLTLQHPLNHHLGDEGYHPFISRRQLILKQTCLFCRLRRTTWDTLLYWRSKNLANSLRFLLRSSQYHHSPTGNSVSSSPFFENYQNKMASDNKSFRTDKPGRRFGLQSVVTPGLEGALGRRLDKLIQIVNMCMEHGNDVLM